MLLALLADCVQVSSCRVQTPHLLMPQFLQFLGDSLSTGLRRYGKEFLAWDVPLETPEVCAVYCTSVWHSGSKLYCFGWQTPSKRGAADKGPPVIIISWKKIRKLELAEGPARLWKVCCVLPSKICRVPAGPETFRNLIYTLNVIYVSY